MFSYFKFWKEETGATAIEYAACTAFIIVVCIGAVRSLGNKAGEVWGNNSVGIISFLQGV